MGATKTPAEVTYLKFVKDPGVLEGTFTHFLGFLFELFDGSLVDTTALVDQVTSGGGFTRIDVADNDNVNMSFFLSHCFSVYLHPKIIKISLMNSNINTAGDDNGHSAILVKKYHMFT